MVIAVVLSYVEIPLKRDDHLMTVSQIIQNAEDKASHPENKRNNRDHFS